MSDEAKVAGRIGAGVVAEIAPGPEGGPPLFKILRHDYEVQEAGPNVRPCPHPSFVLDQKWATVTCAECRERVDSFAALMRYAEWMERFKSRQAMAEDAEKRMHVAHLRALRRRRALTDEQRAEIDTALAREWKLSSVELEALSRRMERAVRDAREAAMLKRRHRTA